MVILPLYTRVWLRSPDRWGYAITLTARGEWAVTYCPVLPSWVVTHMPTGAATVAPGLVLSASQCASLATALSEGVHRWEGPWVKDATKCYGYETPRDAEGASVVQKALTVLRAWCEEQGLPCPI